MAHQAERRVLVRRAEGKLVEIGLAQKDCARLAKARHDDRVASRNMAAPDVGGSSRWHALQVDDVFQRNRHAMERTAVMTACELCVSLSSLSERMVCQHRDIGVDGWIAFGDSLEALQRG